MIQPQAAVQYVGSLAKYTHTFTFCVDEKRITNVHESFRTWKSSMLVSTTTTKINTSDIQQVTAAPDMIEP